MAYGYMPFAMTDRTAAEPEQGLDTSDNVFMDDLSGGGAAAVFSLTAHKNEKRARLVREGTDSSLTSSKNSIVSMSLEELLREEDQLRSNIVTLDKFYQERKTRLQHRIQELEDRRSTLERERRLERRSLQQHLYRPVGDWTIWWVEDIPFNVVSSIVICLNVATVIVGLVQAHLREHMNIADQCFLLFYIFELAARACYHRRGLLLGPPSHVLVRWMLLLVVALGIVHYWFFPVFMRLRFIWDWDNFLSSRFEELNRRTLGLMKAVLILRLWTPIGMLLDSDLSWVDSNFFHSFIMVIIFLNTLTLGAELDIPWDGWVVCDHAFLVVYCIEIIARMGRDGKHFFTKPRERGWNILDLTIVISGVADQWLMPFLRILAGRKENFSSLLPLLRMLRLLRVLRLARLLRGVKPLHNLLSGVLEAMEGMKWVLVLTVVVLYAFAILATALVGHGLLWQGHEPAEAEGMFETVPQSMFLLFKVMNDDQSVMGPLFSNEYSIVVKCFFVVFMVVSNWAALAILTAVVSQNMISATQRNEEHERLEFAKLREAEAAARLQVIFDELDVNGDKTVDEEEFQSMLNDTGLSQDLCEASERSPSELREFFRCFSKVDENGKKYINYDHFLDKMTTSRSAVNEGSVYRMENAFSNAEESMNRQLRDVQKVLGDLQEVIRISHGLPREEVTRSLPTSGQSRPQLDAVELRRGSSQTSRTSPASSRPSMRQSWPRNSGTASFNAELPSRNLSSPRLNSGRLKASL